MQLSALSRWHCAVIAVVIGVLVGAALRGSAAEPYGPVADGLGRQLTNPERFESALVDELAGQRLFKDLVVHPRRTIDGHGRPVPVDVVASRYCDGRVTAHGGGDRATAVWRPTCFVASRPYRPTGGRPPMATVSAYLGTLPGVRFTVAWWEAYPYTVGLMLGLIVVGGVWPTVVNLVAFGTVGRPARAKGIRLWGVDSRPPATAGPAAASAPAFTVSDAISTAAAAVSPALPVDPIIPPSLTSETLPAVVAQTAEAIEYGKRREDFYPTAKGARRP